MPQTLNVGARSLFVTAVAWVFIVLSALASVSALIQNAAVASLLPGAAAAAMPVQPLPLLSGLLLGYLPWVVGVALTVSLATLASAVGRRPAAAVGLGAPRLHRHAGAGHRLQPARPVAAA